MGWAGLVTAVVITCALAPLLLRLRALAEWRLPSSVQRRPGPPRLQATVEDLFAPIDAELRELGFVPSHAAELRATPRGLTPWQPLRLYRHRHYPMIAQLAGPLGAQWPNLPLLELYAEVKEGLVVATSNRPWRQVPPHQLVLKSGGERFASVRSQYERQLAAMHAEGLPDFLPWGDAADIEARLESFEQRLLEAALQRGWCTADGETLAFTPSRLLDLAWRQWRHDRELAALLRDTGVPATLRERQAPLERSLALFVATKARPRARVVPAVQWTLYLASSLPLLFACAVVGGPLSALLALPVLVLHDLGRWAALRACGERNPQLGLWPLVGGPGFDAERRPAPRERTLLLLAGALPGLLLGGLLWVAAPEVPALRLLAGWLWLLNGIALLPLPPLPGAELLAMVGVRRRPAVRLACEALCALAVAAWCWHLGWQPAAALAVLLLALRAPGWRALLRQGRFERRYRAAARRQPPPDARAIARLCFQLLERMCPAAALSQRIPMVEALLARLRAKDGRPAQLLPLAVLQLGVLVPVLALAPAALDGLMQARAGLAGGSRPDAAAEARLRALDIGALAAALDPRPQRQGASELALAALAQRTGAPLPPEVRELYLARDGLDAGAGLSLLPSADVQPLRDNRPRLAAQLGARLRELHPRQPVPRVEQACATPATAACQVALEQVLSWLQVGQVQGRPLLLHPRPEGRGWRLVSLDTEQGRLAEEAGLRELLQQRWREGQGGPASAAE